MSNRTFQNVISQFKEATDRVIGVIDNEGAVVACSDMSLSGEKWPQAFIAAANANGSAVIYDRKALKVFGNTAAPEYAGFVFGDDDLAASLVVMEVVALSQAKIYYEEKHDKGTFVKNIITDNIMPADVYTRAKELHFTTEVPRAVYLVRQIGRADGAAIDVLHSMFTDRQQNFVISVNESDIAIIQQLPANWTNEDITATAKKIEAMLREELFVKTVIGIGTVSTHLRELAESYKEAQVAIEVGKVFETEKSIINYENLGIGRLIYQLPTTLCEIYLSEVFKKNTIDALDADTLTTINQFFEYSLNVSETSRNMYIHRNTLVYRLEKIKKLTGLDLRKFDDAIVFKVALMVRKYLASRDNRLI